MSLKHKNVMQRVRAQWISMEKMLSTVRLHVGSVSPMAY